MSRNALIAPIVIVLLAVVFRLIPHPPNVAPLGAVALFGAAFFKRKALALLLPLLALWLSNLILNNTLYADLYPGFVVFSKSFSWVGLGLVLIAVAGQFMLRKKNLKNLFVSTLTASVIFFVVSNFGVWLNVPMYTNDLAGLLMCYEAAIPFFWGTLAGDFIYVTVFFGGYYLVRKFYMNEWPVMIRVNS